MNNCSKVRIFVWLVILAITGLCGYIIYMILPAKPNTPAYFYKHYGITRRMLEETTSAYNVAIEDMPIYGPDPFPINYAKHELGWNEQNNIVVRREDVESVVQGVQSRCEMGPSITLYLFHTRWMDNRNFVGGGPLFMMVSYDIHHELGREQDIVERINEPEFGPDTGIDWQSLAEECDPPAIYRNQE